jgi:sugar phosphate isomerase/epimerase
MPKLLLFLFTITIIVLFACKSQDENKETKSMVKNTQKIPKYSLAQWSFNRELFSGEMNNYDFIQRAAELGFETVEYVNQFFIDKAENFEFLDSLNNTAKEAGIKNWLLMVDGAGLLGSQDETKRNEAIAEHKKWIDAASYLGCSYMRVNAHGDGSPADMLINCETSIRELAEYGAARKVSIVIENHGGISNDGSWLKKLLSKLQDKNVGSLTDFDNWCIERENGKLWGAPCSKEYPRYQGMEDLLPFAKALSVKAFEFDEKGNETTIDFKKMFELIDKYDYQEYLSIEYEGHTLPSTEGIIKTRELANKYFIAD